MEAKSYFMLSPLYTLDQDDTFTGIDKLQVFINRFPNSEYLTEALELMEQLQNKIEKKEFEISKQYYTIRDYSSAMKSLDNFISGAGTDLVIQKETKIKEKNEAQAIKDYNENRDKFAKQVEQGNIPKESNPYYLSLIHI